MRAIRVIFSHLESLSKGYNFYQKGIKSLYGVKKHQILTKILEFGFIFNGKSPSKGYRTSKFGLLKGFF